MQRPDSSVLLRKREPTIGAFHSLFQVRRCVASTLRFWTPGTHTSALRPGCQSRTIDISSYACSLHANEYRVPIASGVSNEGCRPWYLGGVPSATAINTKHLGSVSDSR